VSTWNIITLKAMNYYITWYHTAQKLKAVFLMVQKSLLQNLANTVLLFLARTVFVTMESQLYTGDICNTSY